MKGWGEEVGGGLFAEKSKHCERGRVEKKKSWWHGVTIKHLRDDLSGEK